MIGLGDKNMKPSAKKSAGSALEERRIAVRQFRKQLKLSQTELAQLAGLNHSMVSRFEKGSRDLSPAAFERLEQAILDALAKRQADTLKAEKVLGARLTPGAVKRIQKQSKALSGHRVPSGMTPEQALEIQAEAGEKAARFFFERYEKTVAELAAEKQRLQLAEQLISKQQQLLDALRHIDVLSQAIEQRKDAQIAELQERVKNLREVWDAGLVHEKAEREVVTA